MIHQNFNSKENESKTPDMGLSFLKNWGGPAAHPQSPASRATTPIGALLDALSKDRENTPASHLQSPAERASMPLDAIADALNVSRNTDRSANGFGAGWERKAPPPEMITAAMNQKPAADSPVNDSGMGLSFLNPHAWPLASIDSVDKNERIAREETKDLLTNRPTRRWKKALDDALSGWDADGSRKEFAERLWDKTIDGMNDAIGKFGRMIGVVPELFGKERDGLLWEAMNDIEQRCRHVVDDRQDRMYGCTNLQGVSLEYPGGPLPMPMNTTFLAYEWGDEYLAAAMHHEASHQAIHRVRQMIDMDLAYRKRIRGDLPIDEQEYAELEDFFEDLERRMDQTDLSAFNPATGKIQIDKMSDAISDLEGLVDWYISIRQ